MIDLFPLYSIRRITGRSVNVEHDDFFVGLVGTVFHFQANIFEKLRVPQRLKVSPNPLHAIGIAVVAKICERAACRSGCADFR